MKNIQRTPQTYQSMPATSNYYGECISFEEYRPLGWKCVIPLFLVVGAGAVAYHFGLSTGTSMAGQLDKLDTKVASTSLTKRVVIGDSDPDLMVAQPTPIPEVPLRIVEKSASRPVSRHVVASRPATATTNVFADQSIPFRPAEEFSPTSNETLPDAQAPDNGETSEEPKAPLPNPTAAPEQLESVTTNEVSSESTASN